MCVYCVENVSTALTYIALNALEILTPCVDSVDIHSIENITLHYLMLCINSIDIDSIEYITHFHVLYRQCRHR